MERSRAVLITLVCVWFSRISGAEVEMRVRPGADVTLYSDCFSEAAFNIFWFRNSSCDQPSLIISTQDLIQGALPHYSAVWNPSNKTHDLLVKNVSESDVGLYYCAVYEKKITKDEKGVILSEEIYHYGQRTTRLSLLRPCTDLSQTPSTPPVSDCSVCWKLLVSVCPVCVLLSSTCVCCIYRYTTKAEAELGQERRNKTQRRKSRTTDEVEGNEVCYASLDLPSRGQKQLKKKKRVESSNFSTYSVVKTDI